jgi:hypothetical protein
MSGPYAIARFGDDLFGGAPRDGATVIVPTIINAAQHASAALYARRRTSTKHNTPPPSSTWCRARSAAANWSARASCRPRPCSLPIRMPQTAGLHPVFRRQQPDPQRLPRGLPGRLAAHPCDQSATSPLACSPAHNLRKWLVRNDLRSYMPSAPTMLCGGHDDPTVPYFNATAAASYFRARGAITELDIDDTPSLNDPYRSAQGRLRGSQVHPARGLGDSAVASSYHAGLVAPFCMAATRDYFQSTWHIKTYDKPAALL